MFPNQLSQKNNQGGVNMAEGKVVEISDADFESEVLKADLPTLVDFWAPWCGPCKAITPVIQEMSEEYDGKIKFAKMNVDNNPETPGKFGIRAIPTLILFKNGEVADQVTGAVGKDQLSAMVEK
ncbi:MAG: thioredoxin [Desulfurivibrionaceae bacterium]